MPRDVEIDCFTTSCNSPDHRSYTLLFALMAQSPRLSRLPLWISHWLGYRRSESKSQPSYIVYVWSFVGAFCGLALLQAVFGQAQYFIDRNVPSIIASYVCISKTCWFSLLMSWTYLSVTRVHLPYSVTGSLECLWANLGLWYLVIS